MATSARYGDLIATMWVGERWRGVGMKRLWLLVWPIGFD